METSVQSKGNPPGHDKEFNIIVNTRPEVWKEKKITYEQVIIVAYGEYIDDEFNVYSITFTKGEKPQHEGSLTKGKSVPVKDGMIFDVTHTNRS